MSNTNEGVSFRELADTAPKQIQPIKIPASAASIEQQLMDVATSSYRPSLPGNVFSISNGNFTNLYLSQDIEAMQRDSVVAMPLEYAIAPTSLAEWNIEASCKEVADYGAKEIKRLWSMAGKIFFEGKSWGWCGGETVYDIEDGLLSFKEILMPSSRDVRLLTAGGLPVGVRILRATTNSTEVTATKNLDLWGDRLGLPPKAFWWANKAVYGQYYGRPLLGQVWRFWRRLRGRDGADDIFDLGTYRHALGVTMVSYPNEDTLAQNKPGWAGSSTQRVAAKDIARQLAENIRYGSSVAMPSNMYSQDEGGGRKWALDFKDARVDLRQLIEVIKSLEDSISKGLGWPPELTEASETGSGFSGRMLPFMNLLLRCDSDVMSLTKVFELMIRAAVRWNFGWNEWIRFSPIPLLQIYKKFAMENKGPDPQQPPPGQPGAEQGQTQGEQAESGMSDKDKVNLAAYAEAMADAKDGNPEAAKEAKIHKEAITQADAGDEDSAGLELSSNPRVQFTETFSAWRQLRPGEKNPRTGRPIRSQNAWFNAQTQKVDYFHGDPNKGAKSAAESGQVDARYTKPGKEPGSVQIDEKKAEAHKKLVGILDSMDKKDAKELRQFAQQLKASVQNGEMMVADARKAAQDKLRGVLKDQGSRNLVRKQLGEAEKPFAGDEYLNQMAMPKKEKKFEDIKAERERAASMAASGVPEEKVKEYSATMDSVRNSMPPDIAKEVGNLIKDTKFFASPRELNDYAAKNIPAVAKAHAEGKSVLAVYDRKTGTLLVNGGGKGKNARQVYAHAFTHMLDGKAKSFSNSPDWKEAWQKEISQGQLGKHASLSPAEGFAEAGRAMYANAADPEVMKQTMPMTYKFFLENQLIDGQKNAGTGVPPDEMKEVFSGAVDEGDAHADVEDDSEMGKVNKQFQDAALEGQGQEDKTGDDKEQQVQEDAKAVLENNANAVKQTLSQNVQTLPIDQIHVDPQRFQYKLNTRGKYGTTNKYSDVEKFDNNLAGVVGVWQDPADGKTYIVNGHHRYELAKRDNQTTMDVKYIKAKDAREARAIGALINIAEEKGTSLDAAKFMRDTGTTPEDFKKNGISLKGNVTKDAVNLNKLSDEMFSEVVKGNIPEKEAATIGANISSPANQKAFWDALQKQREKGKKYSVEEIEQAAQDADLATTSTKTESTLFGDDEQEVSHLMSRAKLKVMLKRELAKDIKIFAGVADQGKADKLKGKGNELNVDANKAEVDELRQAEEAFERESKYKGELSDLLNQYAEKYDGAQTDRERQEIGREVQGKVRSYLREALAGGVRSDVQGGPESLRSDETASQPEAEAVKGEAKAEPAPEVKEEPKKDEGTDLFGNPLPKTYQAMAAKTQTTIEDAIKDQWLTRAQEHADELGGKVEKVLSDGAFLVNGKWYQVGKAEDGYPVTEYKGKPRTNAVKEPKPAAKQESPAAPVKEEKPMQATLEQPETTKSEAHPDARRMWDQRVTDLGLRELDDSIRSASGSRKEELQARKDKRLAQLKNELEEKFPGQFDAVQGQLQKERDERQKKKDEETAAKDKAKQERLAEKKAKKAEKPAPAKVEKKPAQKESVPEPDVSKKIRKPIAPGPDASEDDRKAYQGKMDEFHAKVKEALPGLVEKYTKEFGNEGDAIFEAAADLGITESDVKKALGENATTKGEKFDEEKAKANDAKKGKAGVEKVLAEANPEDVVSDEEANADEDGEVDDSGIAGYTEEDIGLVKRYLDGYAEDLKNKDKSYQREAASELKRMARTYGVEYNPKTDSLDQLKEMIAAKMQKKLVKNEGKTREVERVRKKKDKQE